VPNRPEVRVDTRDLPVGQAGEIVLAEIERRLMRPF
jgi:hypothetical protein